eukprot:TRINITY_DN3733_c2_g1_i3.p2 TRINITY_DN3733_c2_g1~~TRINITY_DN3733_c2_g1_i3.p2  ORF type:complete len:102 (-),score=10.24 TRINITY_DN3733_c2_g1_i3:207-512(-)
MDDFQKERIYVEVVDVTEIGRFGVKNRYDSELLTIYRRMISTHNARWDGDEKIWTFPEQYETSVVDILRKCDNVIIKDKRLARKRQGIGKPFSAEGASPYA